LSEFQKFKAEGGELEVKKLFVAELSTE